MSYSEVKVDITRVDVRCEACGTKLYASPRWIFKADVGESFHFCDACYNLIKNHLMPITGSFDFVRIIKFRLWCDWTGRTINSDNINDLIQEYISQLSTDYSSDIE